jgi:hypothetical protein
MRRLVLIVGCWMWVVGTSASPAAVPHDELPVVVFAQAPAVVHAAARDLAAYLHRLYPRQRFSVAQRLPDAGVAIVVGSVDADPPLRSLLGAKRPAGPESYVVTVAEDGRRRLGLIAGADTRGAAYGVYALLEKLGCAFTLSGDAAPVASEQAFSLAGWQLADRPLVGRRLVFNWHNFLSGCSTWNLPEWQAWIRQSQRMGFNAVMVHVYGNNPMVSFQFNGRTKPVGFLSSTVQGRDWSTQHVADVRRLWGGDVFRDAVFGADAALAPGDRAANARNLMRQVFTAASQQALDVYFADDVDTPAANPQELIETLPPDARFWTAKTGAWLANPDTPAGYAYYKAQVAALVEAYPQITCLVVWFRTKGTPWLDVRLEELPTAWQAEYRAELARTPEAARLWNAHNMFALGKVVRAFDRALEDLGQRQIRLAAGTWSFEFLEPCHRFFPRHVALIGLDYNVLHDRPQLGDAASRQVIARVGAQREVIPVIWAHHDDGNYLGRPYPPFGDFHSKLADARAAGFGIIHWTTRPLDLFFTSHARQVWQATRNEPLRTTCDDLAAKWFGPSARGAMGEYLQRWVSAAPMFARETSDFFIDRPLIDVPQVVAGCRQRLERLTSVDRTALAAVQRDRLDYYRGLEEFIAAFYATHETFQNAQAAAKKGDLVKARSLMADCHPEPVIEKFAQFSSLGGITRGEQGLVVSLNLRWLPHYVQLRQALGMESVRYRFGPTSHDKLAQYPGRFTYYFDREHQLWQTLGTEETGAQSFALRERGSRSKGLPLTPAPLPQGERGSGEVPDPQEKAGAETPADDELCHSGIQSNSRITITVRPVLERARLAAGKYQLRLVWIDPDSTAPGQREFAVSVAGGPDDRVDIFKEAGQRARKLERTYPVTVGRDGQVQIMLTPLRGKALLSACMLEPIPTPRPVPR